MGPKTSFVIAKMIKAGIKNVRVIPHLLAVLANFRRNNAMLRDWRRASEDTVLISLIEHMGDIIAAEPLSRLARRDHPDAAIGWVARKAYVDVAENFKAVDKVVTVECMTEWLLLWSMQRTGVTWDLHISERPCLKCGIFFRKPGRPGSITYKTYYESGNLLTVNCLNADLPPFNDAPRIIPDHSAIRAVDKLSLPERIVVIHCKSNEDVRDWRLDKWNALVAWIVDHTDFTVCEIGTQPHVLQSQAPQTRNLCGMLSIMETAEVIRRGALFIGIDSGPAHLANATHTPGVILLGRYQGFAAYTPYSGGYGDGTLADLIRTNGLAADIDVEPVIAAVSSRLKSGRLVQAASTNIEQLD
jgi:heptosyltransferase-3